MYDLVLFVDSQCRLYGANGAAIHGGPCKLVEGVAKFIKKPSFVTDAKEYASQLVDCGECSMVY